MVSRTAEVASYLACFGAYYFLVRLSMRFRWHTLTGPLGAFCRAFIGHDAPAGARSDSGKGGIRGGAPAETFRQRTGMLIFCIAGIQISYLCWGVMQERIMTRTYEGLREGGGTEPERFRSSKFLVFANRLAALLVAHLASRREPEPAAPAPPFRYSYCATSNVLSSVCQYEALKYVSFPTQVLAKSCKMVPTMVMGYVVSRRGYPLLDWLVAFAVTAGVVTFKLHEAEDAGAAGKAAGGQQMGAELAGYVLIVGYMAFDSFTSNWQEALFREYSPSPVRMMRQVNLFSSSFAFLGLLLTAEAFTVPAFLARHPDCAVHVLLMSACSAVGQLFIFFTIKRFGALVFATINTVRTMFSVLLSYAVFGHDINSGEALGILLVFASLAFQVYSKWRRQAKSGAVDSGSQKKMA